MKTPEVFTLWAGAIIGVIVLIVGSVPRLAGSWNEWLDARRRAAAASVDADLAEMKRQLSYLRSEIDRLYCRIEAHQLWVREAYRRLINYGDNIGPPPPLI